MIKQVEVTDEEVAFYLTEARTLMDKLLVHMESVPHFSGVPEDNVMFATLTLSLGAGADLEQLSTLATAALIEVRKLRRASKEQSISA